MATDNLLAKLYQSPKTVLTTKDIALIWNETNTVNLLSKVKYYTKQKSIVRLTRGVYAKNHQYDLKELATSIYTPSYISFETVLREAGIIFQHQTAIFVASPYPASKTIDSHSMVFRKLKNSVLYNGSGVKKETTYGIATPERALLDTLYLFPTFYFDNLRPINWQLCDELVGLYENKQLIKRLASYKKYAQ